MANEKNLETNRTDLLTSFSKSALSVIPIAGPFLSEIIGTIIPNQRIDRLIEYIIELDKRISKIEIARLEELSRNEEFIDLTEEGFIQASRATTSERRQYIASIIESGINDEAINFLQSKHLLKLLSELNDIEIIWLRSFLDSFEESDVEFRDKHKNVLKPIKIYVGVDQETLNSASIQDSYKDHLERLRLIESKIRIDRKTGFPEFDKFTGKPKTSYLRVTHLGKMLLEQIGLINEKTL
jgi:hypothetical protein